MLSGWPLKVKTANNVREYENPTKQLYQKMTITKCKYAHTLRDREREIRFSVGAAVGLAVCRDRNTATALPVNVVVFTIHSCAHPPMPYNGKVIMDRKRSTNIQIYCTPPPNYCVRLLNVPKHKKQETSSSSNRRSIQCIRNVLRERAPVSNVW